MCMGDTALHASHSQFPEIYTILGFYFQTETECCLSGVFSVVPMLLLFCQCGVVNEFMELPFDAKEHLISYHTESKGEDKVQYIFLKP